MFVERCGKRAPAERFVSMVSAKMTNIVSDLSQKDDEDDLLLFLLASLFERDFSIDWIQAIAEVKATKIMKAFAGFVRDGHLKNHDVGVFSFVDSKKRQQLQAVIPINVQKNLRRLIPYYITMPWSHSYQVLGRIILVDN